MKVRPVTWNLHQTARYLGLNEDTVSRLANDGQIKGTRTVSKYSNEPSAVDWLFERDDVEAYIEAMRVQPGTLSKHFGGRGR